MIALLLTLACACPGFSQPYTLPWLPIGTDLPATWGETPIPDGHWCLEGVTIEWARPIPRVARPARVAAYHPISPDAKYLHMINGVPHYPCLVPPPPPPPPNPIFSDGFESGDLTRWKVPR